MRLRYIRRFFLHPIENAIVRIMFATISILPVSIGIRLGGALGVLAFSVLRIRRPVCMKNLKVAFPDRELKELAAIGRRSYANIGRSVMEILLLGKLDPEYFKRHVKYQGGEHVDKLLENGKGALAVTGHFGSWELMASSFHHIGYPVDLLVGHQKNDKVNDLMNSLRKKQGLGLIELDLALRGVLRSLRDNRIVALLGDQDARRRGAGVIVEFFGRPTSVFAGVALFSLKSKAKIICPFIVRNEASAYHTVYMEPPLEYEPTGDKEEDIRNLTQMHTTRLEEWIKRYPDHWFWGHKRWKSTGMIY